MLEQLTERILPTIVAALELMGIFIVAASALSAFGRYLRGLFTRTLCDVKFALVNGLTLSLKFRVTAKILKTVLVRNLKKLLVLGTVVLLRALLSFLIHFEIRGAYPPK